MDANRIKFLASFSLITLASLSAHASITTESISVSDKNQHPNTLGSGLGTVGFNTTSFFYKSNDRGTSSTTFEASIAGKADQVLFHEQADFSFYSFVSNESQLSLESKEAYVSTQKGLLGDHEFTVGRRAYEWSKVDQSWNMMSLWSPRFNWDPLKPQSIGLTGLFYTYDTPSFHFMAYGSPIAIPERGSPIEEKDGAIVSSNPFWKQPPTKQMVNGVETKIHYTLMMPSMQSILMRPNAAIKAKYEFGGGLWSSFGTGILPVHATPLAAEPFLDSSTGIAQVNIRPQLPMRNLNTIETGFEGRDHDWDVWVSGSYEQPFNFENKDSWLNPVITPASIVSAGTNIQVTSNFWFHGAALVVHEQPYVHHSNLPAVSVDLPSRFPLKQGFQIGGDWKFSEATQGHLQWIQDLIQQNHFVSLEVQHEIYRSGIEIGAGTDFIFAESTKGWVGQYYGDDRIRGWLKYAF